MRPKIGLQATVTLVAILAALLPTLLITLYLYRDGMQEREAAQQGVARHAAWVATRVEQTLQERQEEFDLLLQQAADGAALDSPPAVGSLRVVERMSPGGLVLDSWSKPGQPVLARWWRGAAPDAPAEGSTLLVGVARPDLPDVALAGRIPGAEGQVLVADLDLEPLRLELAQYAGLMGISLHVSGDQAQQASAGGHYPIRGTGLTAAVDAVAHTQTVGWVNRLWLTLATGSLAVPLVVLLARWVGGLLQGTLLQMNVVTARVAARDRRAKVGGLPELAPLELQELAASLDRLAQRFFETEDALVNANQSLEASVTARTEELAQRTVDLGYSRATLYAVMESMNDGLVLTTPDRRIRYINRNTEEMLSLKEPLYPGRAAEGLYEAVTDGCDCEDLPREQVADALVDPEQSPVLTVSREAHDKRYLRWRTFSIYNAIGTHLGLGHLVTDVTQEHEIDRVKSELISIVSHELRTPLTAIRASISSLLRPNVEWDEETRLDFLVTIYEESGHLQELIENLLDMSKIEAGVLRLDLDTASVERLLESVGSRARTLYPDRALSLLIPPGLPSIRIDSRRMEQVLLNLVDNAVKYARESPAIEVKAERHGNELWLAVRDHGQGIPPEHINRIFDRFHRVDMTLTRNTGGNGLGLAICRGIVEGHGGRIWAESEPGQGSTIYIALPIAEEESSHED